MHAPMPYVVYVSDSEPAQDISRAVEEPCSLGYTTRHLLFYALLAGLRMHKAPRLKPLHTVHVGFIFLKITKVIRLLLKQELYNTK